MSPGFNGDETKVWESPFISFNYKNRLDWPGNPVKNLSVAYDIPDTWQIIGFAPSCYNNQSVMDPRTDRMFYLTVDLPVCWSIYQFYICLVMLWAWSMSICVLIDSGNGSKDELTFGHTWPNRPKIPERFIKINNIYAFDDFQQQLVTRIPPNEKLDTPFGYNHLSIMQYSSYS